MSASRFGNVEFHCSRLSGANDAIANIIERLNRGEEVNLSEVDEILAEFAAP